MNNILASVANVSSPNVNQQNSPTALAERADIHKSCRSIETLLNILNDYCEAATAIVVLEKKLAKALRETASSKVTNQVAANALNASASIFDVLADVDAKFVKIADKEYDAISKEVKKWFKRLAKEEKTHDERIADSNARIKQAGINFEKKSKKRAGDVPEEHSKYIQLISTLGPEIAQEKYNHTLQTTQRHTLTVYSIAASLSRIADTEWIRCCENVRRFAPTVGVLGEWRALCEGGWIRDVPKDLIDIDRGAEDNLKLNTIQERGENEEGSKNGQGKHQAHPLQHHHGDNTTTPLRPAAGPQRNQDTSQLYNKEPYNGRETTPASYQPLASSPGSSPILRQTPAHDFPTTEASAPSPTRASILHPTLQPSLAMPPIHKTDDDRGASTALTEATRTDLYPASPSLHQSRSHPREESPTSDREHLFSDPVTGSVRSLSAFPAPPNYFPLPPPRPKDPPSQKTQTISVIRESREEQTYITGERERLNESPLPLEVDETNKEGEYLSSPEQLQQQPRRSSGDERLRAESLDISRSSTTPGMSKETSLLTSTAATPSSPIDDRSGADAGDNHELYVQEFGAIPGRASTDGPVGKAFLLSTNRSNVEQDDVEFPSVVTPVLERSRQAEKSGTGSSATGSIVAAMRSRYSNTSGSQSPVPLPDVPRLQASVNELASRYQPSPPSKAHAANTNSAGVATETRSPKSPRTQQSPLQSATKSPPAIGRRMPLPTTPERAEPRLRGGIASPSRTPTSSIRPLPRDSPSRPRTRDSSDNAEDFILRRRAEEELTEMEYRKRERDLMEREQEILMREKELERDRARILSYKDDLAASSGNGNANNPDYGELSNSRGTSPLQFYPKERRISFRRARQNSQPRALPPGRDLLSSPPGRLEPSSSNPNLRERHQSHHSYSSPPLSTNTLEFNTSSTSGSGSGHSSYLSRSTGSPPVDQTSLQPRLEKKGGWMRRLSMPVGSALPFSLDSSKRQTNNSGSSAASSVSPSVNVKQLGAGIVGGKGVGGVMTDERRNQSGVNLGLGGREGDRGREYGYDYAQTSQGGGREGGRFSALGHIGLGRRSHDTRSATNLKSGSRK